MNPLLALFVVGVPICILFILIIVCCSREKKIDTFVPWEFKIHDVRMVKPRPYLDKETVRKEMLSQLWNENMDAKIKEVKDR